MFQGSNPRHSIHVFDVLYEAARDVRAADARLHAALGGEDGIAAIVDGFVRLTSLNPRLRHHLEAVNLVRFRLMLRRLFTALAGGPPSPFPFVQVGSAAASLDLPTLEALLADLEAALTLLGVEPRQRARFLQQFQPLQQIAA